MHEITYITMVDSIIFGVQTSLCIKKSPITNELEAEDFAISGRAHVSPVQNYELTRRLDAFIGHQSGQVCSAARVTPLVVVPAHNFNHPVLHLSLIHI